MCQLYRFVGENIRMVFPAKDDKAFRLIVIVFTLVCLSLLVVFQSYSSKTNEVNPDDFSKELDEYLKNEEKKAKTYKGRIFQLRIFSKWLIVLCLRIVTHIKLKVSNIFQNHG